MAIALIYQVLVVDLAALAEAIRINVPGLDLLEVKHLVISSGPETHVYVADADPSQKDDIDQIVAATVKRDIAVEVRQLP